MIKPEDGIIKWIPGKSESIEHLRIRAKQAWEKIKEIAQENHYENILVIWHIGINRALVAEILGYEDLQKAKKQHNAALSVYDVPPIGPVQIIVENDVTHLQDIVTTSTADL
jgi:broad specificity phosphatase PhoE